MEKWMPFLPLKFCKLLAILPTTEITLYRELINCVYLLASSPTCISKRKRKCKFCGVGRAQKVQPIVESLDSHFLEKHILHYQKKKQKFNDAWKVKLQHWRSKNNNTKQFPKYYSNKTTKQTRTVLKKLMSDFCIMVCCFFVFSCI